MSNAEVTREHHGSGTAPPSAVKARVQADINGIFLALGAVALLVGGLGTATVTLLSARERIGEIGLRRALGAGSTDIGAQFLVESVVIGLLGGLIGAAIGVFVLVAVSVAKEWTPILDTRIVIASALLGGVIGLGAGTYPALKVAGIVPITALRGAGWARQARPQSTSACVPSTTARARRSASSVPGSAV